MRRVRDYSPLRLGSVTSRPSPSFAALTGSKALSLRERCDLGLAGAFKRTHPLVPAMHCAPKSSSPSTSSSRSRLWRSTVSCLPLETKGVAALVERQSGSPLCGARPMHPPRRLPASVLLRTRAGIGLSSLSLLRAAALATGTEGLTSARGSSRHVRRGRWPTPPGPWAFRQAPWVTGRGAGRLETGLPTAGLRTPPAGAAFPGSALGSPPGGDHLQLEAETNRVRDKAGPELPGIDAPFRQCRAAEVQTVSQCSRRQGKAALQRLCLAGSAVGAVPDRTPPLATGDRQREGLRTAARRGRGEGVHRRVEGRGAPWP